jgi:hypothetical protein
MEKRGATYPIGNSDAFDDRDNYDESMKKTGKYNEGDGEEDPVCQITIDRDPDSASSVRGTIHRTASSQKTALVMKCNLLYLELFFKS